MRSLEVKAKTIDEAISQGLLELNLPKEAVDVEILQEPEAGSFLGFGRKLAIVKLTELEKTTSCLTSEANTETKAACNALSVAECVDAKEAAYKFLEDILANMHVEHVLKCEEDEESLHFNISGDDCGILIGRRGETLRSLQYLTSLVVHQAGSEKRVILDIGDYFEKRKQALIHLAKSTAKRSLLNGNAYELSPMRSLDRRIIHEALTGIKGLLTYSEGDEPNRYVVIDLSEDYVPNQPLPAELCDVTDDGDVTAADNVADIANEDSTQLED